MILMGFFKGTLNVNHCQKHEHEGLNERHQYPHQHHRQRYEERGKPEKDHKNQLVAVHVAEKTQGKRDRAAKMSDNFNEKHDRSKPGYRSAEMLQIVQAMMFDPYHVRREENDYGACSSCIYIGCWWKKSGY